jgi:hypothetical protein
MGNLQSWWPQTSELNENSSESDCENEEDENNDAEEVIVLLDDEEDVRIEVAKEKEEEDQVNSEGKREPNDDNVNFVKRKKRMVVDSGSTSSPAGASHDTAAAAPFATTTPERDRLQLLETPKTPEAERTVRQMTGGSKVNAFLFPGADVQWEAVAGAAVAIETKLKKVAARTRTDQQLIKDSIALAQEIVELTGRSQEPPLLNTERLAGDEPSSGSAVD